VADCAIYDQEDAERFARALLVPAEDFDASAWLPDTELVFAALADPEGLARFVPQLTSIRHGDGDRVEVEARYEGRTQRGEA
jgi:hypothetical protein